MRTYTSLAYKALALAAAVSLAACGGGSSSSTPSIPVTPSGSGVLTNIVGIGDSLTAGEQAGGVLGDGSLPDPFYPGLNVPPTQESSWWSQFYMDATGANYAVMANPATSVLPLIAKPGLGNQLVPNNAAVTGVPLPFLPLSQAISGHGCDSFDTAGYSAATFAATRMNASAQPKNIAVPGMTLHEAVTMYQPPSPACAPITGAPAQIVGLQQLLSEGQYFYPTLGTFTGVRPMTELNVALALHPTLTTVWLGANDVLHFAFSGGAFTGADNAAQAQADLTQIVSSLQRAGSAVVVANVPDVLKTPFYFSVATPPAPQACQLQNFTICDLEALGVPAANAAAITSSIATKYGLGTSGYLTLQGFLSEVTASPQFSADLDALAGGNGLGSMYVTPALAASIQQENDAINSGIAAAASATGVPMVDIKTMFDDVASGNVQDPYAAQALSVSPGKCCSLAFLGGLLSFDGLHPSNTAYALVANGFIDAINAKYKTTVSDINISSVYNGTGAIPFPDPYAQH
jgi:lysophospholipase L1-like esterase